jgi:hypothetical protein
MSEELPDVPSLRRLDPPPGGLARLRATLDNAGGGGTAADKVEKRPAVWRRWLMVAAPTVALAALAIWFVTKREPTAPTVTEPPALLADPQVSPDFYWAAPSRTEVRATVAAPLASEAAPAALIDPSTAFVPGG